MLLYFRTLKRQKRDFHRPTQAAHPQEKFKPFGQNCITHYALHNCISLGSRKVPVCLKEDSLVRCRALATLVATLVALCIIPLVVITRKRRKVRETSMIFSRTSPLHQIFSKSKIRVVDKNRMGCEGNHVDRVHNAAIVGGACSSWVGRYRHWRSRPFR